ncbi:MAG TPA: 30S ribosome-binding factor RbfA [Terriglobales bacterium]|nr:30S ribosome-binding factor RbfA [Terriglobales bacterium]
MPHRQERIAETLRDELNELIEGELADPRIGLATVSEVKLEPPMRLALVYVTVAGDAHEQQQSLQGLMAARGFLKTELAHRLQVRRVPDLRFELDRSSEYNARLDALLRRSRQRNPESTDKEGEKNG